MINCKIGDVLLRITPPSAGRPGYSQAGIVTHLTDKVIELSVQVDMVRLMRFNRVDGKDQSGIGSFVVHQDLNL